MSLGDVDTSSTSTLAYCVMVWVPACWASAYKNRLSDFVPTSGLTDVRNVDHPFVLGMLGSAAHRSGPASQRQIRAAGPRTLCTSRPMTSGPPFHASD